MPLCFEIQINEDESVLAGVADVSVLTACLTFVAAHNEMELRTGGLVSKDPHDNEYIDWVQRKLRTGDRVTIRIVESDQPSAPILRERQDPALAEREERRYYELLKARYEPQ